MNYERKQDLVTMRIPRELRDKLKQLSESEMRTMVAQLAYMVSKESNNG